jgi:putative lipoic acid-binding regulatory protein
MDRAEALELLRSVHTFPGPYRCRVVVRAGRTAGVVTAVRAMFGDRLTDVGEQASRNGTYLSLRLDLLAEQPEDVLEVYDLVRGIEGVIAVL